MLALAYPHPGWEALALVALVPQAVAVVRARSARLSFLAGYIAWTLWWLWMGRWLIQVTFGGYLALALFNGLFIPLTLLAWRRLSRKRHIAATIALPLVCVAFEWVRSVFPFGGFSWYFLGHAFAASTPPPATPWWFVQTADLFGELTVTFLAAMTSGLIVDLLLLPPTLGRGREAGPGAPGGLRGGLVRFRDSRRAAVLVWIVLFGAANAYGAFRIRQSDQVVTAGPRVAVVQTNVPQDNKTRPTWESMVGDFDRLVELIRRAGARLEPAKRPELIVAPETVVLSPLNEHAREVLERSDSPERIFGRTLGALAQRVSCPLVVGAPAYEGWRDGAPERRYNTAYLIDRAGRVTARYDKMHRVPFGEYLPLVDRWPWLTGIFIRYLTPYDHDYSLAPGRGVVRFETPVRRPAPAEVDRDADMDATTDGGTGQEPSVAATKDRSEADLASSESASGQAVISGPPSDEGEAAGSGGGSGGGSVEASDAAVNDAQESGESVTLRVAAPICFEDAVARLCRRMVFEDGRKRVDLLVNLTNDGWYPRSAQNWQHFQIATLRCIENRTPMARSVNTGVSGFIDSAGRIRKLVQREGAHQSVAGSASHRIELDPRTTLFQHVGTWPVVALSAFTGLLLLLPGRGREAGP